MEQEQQSNRRRGGQEGNHNALKHGYYSKIFNREEKADFCLAGAVEGLDEEIALMRHVIKTVASRKDDNSLVIMTRAANALNKLIRTRHRIQPFDDRNFRRTLEKAVRDVAASTGVPCIPASPRHPDINNQSTDRDGNEPGLP